MKERLSLWQWVGAGSVSLAGTLLHFLYDWTGSTAAALFSGVNESTWEHMKLLFFPLFLFAAVEWFYVGKHIENFWCIKLKGTLLGLISIPVLFYTLRGIFGTTPDFINIAIFFLAVAITFIYEARQFKRDALLCRFEKWAFAVLCLIALAFFVLTFSPPRIPLFQDPINGSFGLQK